MNPGSPRKEQHGGTGSAASSSSGREQLMTPDTSEGGVDGEGSGLLARGYDGGEEFEMEDRKPGRRHRRKRASFRAYTPDEERAVVRKLDRRLVVFVAGLYMLSFLDRSNIGNARVAGMDEDLDGQPGSYEWALTAFYLAYIAFEWMALLWRVIPAHIYVSMLVLSWGLTASLQALAVNYPMLIFLRVLLGIGEAGFTGVPFYLSFFFKRDELAFRTAIFISAAPLATSFASSLAWLIMKLGSSIPIAPWRLLFLIEGFPSVIMAAIAWHTIPDTPSTTSYLTPRQKKIARLRLPLPPTTTPSPSPLSALLSPTAWLTSAIFFLANLSYSSLPVFLPHILTRMGHTPLAAQALAAPPFLLSFLLVLATAHLSDALGTRAAPLILHALLSAAGYAVLALARDPLTRYLAVYPAAVGFFNVVVLTVAWSLNNQRGEGERGVGFVLMQVVGQCGPLVGTRLYPEGEGPFYVRGMAVCAGGMVGVAVLAGGLRGYLGWRNGVLDRREGEGEGEGEGLVRGGTGGEKGFRYML
ncbi:major facilitator superfamily domain-containing protein [Podospora conica]|nr:major facilitator superfamily domain-containing protein [Schizothecium conicum]